MVDGQECPSYKQLKLSKTMTEQQFLNGYFYATEIKAFAKEIGIQGVSTLRKDELEELILRYLRTGEVVRAGRSLAQQSAMKDSDRGLDPKLPIVQYTNNRQTKEFLLREAKQLEPNFKPKSGAMYRLNRWREEQINDGRVITYGDLVAQYVALCQTEGSFPQAASGRYINFVSDFLKGEKDATREAATAAWAQLKQLDIPKTYAAWKETK